MHVFENKKELLISIRSDKDFTSDFQDQILTEDILRIQIDLSYSKITKKGWSILGSLIKKKPFIPLRIYGHMTDFDLKLLEYVSDIENLSIEGLNLVNSKSLEQLRNLKSFCLSIDCNNLSFLDYIHKDLQQLYIFSESRTPQKADLSPISRFKNLTFLKISHYGKNLISVVSGLSLLEELFLSSIKVADLAFLIQLTHLKKLGLSSCNISDYTILSRLKELQYLVLYRAASLQNIDFINEMTGLQFLFIQSVNKLTAFPTISSLTKLRKVILYSMKSMNDFTALSESKSLTDFVYYEFKTQKPEDFIPVLENKNIRNVYLWAVKSIKYQNELEELMMRYNRSNNYLQFLGDSDFEYRQ
jgi:hypothetical protein